MKNTGTWFGRKRGPIIAVLLVVMIAAVLLFAFNNTVGVTHVTVYIDDLPNGFEGFKIVQLTDLHSAWFGGEQSELMTKLERENPDIVVFTGDMQDNLLLDLEPTLSLVRQIEVPIYSVSGNHEGGDGYLDGQQLFFNTVAALKRAGVICLENERAEIFRGGQSISLYGISDHRTCCRRYYVESYLAHVRPDPFQKDECAVLLYHRANQADELTGLNVDLILSGHLHGGVIRLPIVGGLLSPERTLFPEYDAGLYALEDGTQLVVSRGLGNSASLPRIFNPPEIMAVTLQKRVS